MVGTMAEVFVLKVIKKGVFICDRKWFARLGVFLKSFEKESIVMNLCNVNGKVPDLKRPYPSE